MHGPGLQVGVLGPFELSVYGRPVTLSAGRLRALVSVLAMSAGRVVSVDRLADGLWGIEPPGNVRRSVQTYVTRLRSALGSELIATTPAGYVLHAGPEHVDALRFGRLLDAAAAAVAGPDEEYALIGEALRLWRGRPFAGVPSERLATSAAPRLVERHLAAIERRVDLDLAAGRHQACVPELRELTAAHPLRESLWVRLLLALDRCGRQAEALTGYETVRGLIADELGVDPSPELRRLHAALLGRRPLDLQPA